jgi:hypothetical protein
VTCSMWDADAALQYELETTSTLIEISIEI